MADWYGSGRSNYFKVTDEEKFKELCQLWGIEAITGERKVITDRCEACLNGKPDAECKEYVKVMVGECKGKEEIQRLHGFLGNTDSGGLPSFREDDETGTEYDFDDFLTELAPIIKENWIAIMEECGAEKLRYITGFAIAINSKGKKESVDLSDIYEKTGSLGKYQTTVEH
jgi:hypothetical protein